jgi:2-aminoadipate transaminase
MKGSPAYLGLPLSNRGSRAREQPISYLISAALGNPELVNLAAGLVDPLTLPARETAQIAAKIMADPVRSVTALQYDGTSGSKPLRQRVLRHLEELDSKAPGGLGVTAEQIILTTGSQQALYLIGDVLIDPGDLVIVESPSYFVYTGTLESFGAKLVGVPMDEGGMDVDALERLLREMESDGRLDRLKLIYCTSYYQNPTGLSLASERRGRMVDLARRFSGRHRLLILEDAAYRELRYDGEALPSIKSHDPENQFTILTQTFSKPFAPGIKLGYTAMPADLAEPVLRQKGNHDFGSSSLCQQIALEALESGQYARHVEELRHAYRAKRDAMVSAVQKFLVTAYPGVRYVHPHGGLYVWVTLPQEIDASRNGKLFAAALERGVLYVPGDYCFGGDNPPKNQLRLSFGQVALERIGLGAQRLAAAMGDIA